MAREGLLVDLRAALARARKENVTVRNEGVPLQSNGQTREVNLDVTPLRGHRREITST
jgi:two-component system, chemotaxis family, CheB/CheR fusion protein